MINCSNCGNEKALLLTRQNPKGQKGIYHCEQCTGALIEINEMNADKLYHLFSTYLSGLPRSVVLSLGEVS